MKLHDYQEYAVKFIEEHPISALLLDMGLGKTITTLTAINNPRIKYDSERIYGTGTLSGYADIPAVQILLTADIAKYINSLTDHQHQSVATTANGES